MTTLITLNIPVGGDAGPFNLYSNTDGYTTPFATGISAAALTAGYTSTVVPNGTTIIRVLSTGQCTNYIDITINLVTTTTTTTLPVTTTTTSSSSTSTTTTTAVPTTTTTSSSSTSTSTSTSTSSTTTTTTTIACDCVNFTLSISQVDLDASDDDTVYIDYVNCAGDLSQKLSGKAGIDTLCTINNEEIKPLLYILVDTVPTTPTESTATRTSVCCNPTTTTTTTNIALVYGFISNTSNITYACSEPLNTSCWISNVGGPSGNETITGSSVVYLDAGATTPFIGDGQFYHVAINSSSISTSCEIDGTGSVTSLISTCP